MVLARSEKLGFEAQIRTTIRHDWSFISGAAVKIGNDVLEVGTKGTYYINGVKNPELPATLSGYPILFKFFDHGPNKRFDRFLIDLGETGEVMIKVYGEFLSIAITRGEKTEKWQGAVGLMGSYETGELVGRDGESVFLDTNLFGVEWQVNDDQPPLFQDAVGPQFPIMCNLPRGKANDHRRRRLMDADGGISYAEAERACQSVPPAARESCIYDATATGNLAMADMGLDF